MNQPLVSVITVTWNGKDDLLEMYESLFVQTYKNYEVILVENGSVDGTSDAVREQFPETKIVQLDKNYGFAGPNNIGLQHASGKYIVTLNNDLTLEPNFLKELVACAEAADENVFAVGSKLTFYHDHNLIQTIGVVPLKNGNATNLGKNELASDHNTLKPIYGPCAGAALYKKSVLDKIGFFDERYFAYLEDLDLAHRANKRGYKALFCPTAVCYHKHSKTSAKLPFFKLYLIERNRLLNLVKHYPWYYLVAETPYTALFVLKHALGKKQKQKISNNQKAYFKASNIPKIMWIYVKARLYLITHYVQFQKQRV